MMFVLLSLVGSGTADTPVALADSPGAASWSIEAKNGNPGILPPNSKAFGKSYGEWSAEFWKWLYSMPTDQHPLFETADCSQNQAGKVWFLGGTFIVVAEPDTGVVVGTADRDCEVPTGTALFFPLVNLECNVFAGDGTNEKELRACAKKYGDLINVDDLSAEVDGVKINNLQAYRVGSPLFEWGPLPENNVLTTPDVPVPAGTTSPAVGDGYYLLLAPLSSGKHTIDFKGRIVIPEFNLDFRLDIHYDITVEPGPKK
jgi:hypothetical protein